MRAKNCRNSAKCGGCREGAAEMPFPYPIDERASYREIEGKEEPASNTELIDEEKRA